MTVSKSNFSNLSFCSICSCFSCGACTREEKVQQKTRRVAVTSLHVPHNSYEISAARIDPKPENLSRTPSTKYIE